MVDPNLSLQITQAESQREKLLVDAASIQSAINRKELEARQRGTDFNPAFDRRRRELLTIQADELSSRLQILRTSKTQQEASARQSLFKRQKQAEFSRQQEQKKELKEKRELIRRKDKSTVFVGGKGFTVRPQDQKAFIRKQLEKGREVKIGKTTFKPKEITRKEELLPKRVEPIVKKQVIEEKKKLISFDKELGKERRAKVKSFVKREIGFNLFEEESKKQEEKILNNADNFGKKRQKFYQNKINKGLISVEEANKKLDKDVDEKFNELVNKNEFFRSDDPRKQTTNAISFKYETLRLDALKKGEKKRADAFLFLGTVAETPSSIVKVGVKAKEGITKLINDPKARETSLNNIKEVLSVEKAKTLPSIVTIKATELTNFVLTSPTTAVAIVGGNLVGFGIVSKAGKPALKMTGIISKQTSKKVIKNLKFDPLVKKGLKDIGKISIEISPKIIKAVGKATRTAKPLAVSTKETKKFVKAFNETIKKSKIGSRAIKIKRGTKKIAGKFTKEQIRIKKRRLKAKLKKSKIIRGLKSFKGVKRLRKIKLAKEKKRLKKLLKKRRKEKIERRKRLLKEAKRKKKLEKIKKELKKFKGVKRVKKVKSKIIRGLKSFKGVKRLRKIKLAKEKKRLKKLLKKRRKEKIERRKRLLKEEKFRKSKLGKLKASAIKKITKLDNIIKKFESPSANLLKKTKRKTPLSKTFPEEIKLGINDKAVKIFVKKQVESRGINFNKLSGIEKNFLIGQVKARIRSNPERFIPKARQLALRRAKRKSELERIRKATKKGREPRDLLTTKQKKDIISRLKRRVKLDPRITLTKTQRIALRRAKRKSEITRVKKAIEKGREPKPIKGFTISKTDRGFIEGQIKTRQQPGQQVLLQIQKPKVKPKVKPRFAIVPAKLSSIQLLALKRLRKISKKEIGVKNEIKQIKTKQKLISEELSTPKFDVKIKVKGKQRIRQRLQLKQKLKSQQKLKQKLNSKIKQLSKIGIRSIILMDQLTKQKIRAKIKPPELIAKISSKSKIKIRSAARIKSKIKPTIKPPRIITKIREKPKLIIPILLKKKKRIVRKPKKKVKKGFNVFARPTKKRKGQKKPKLVRINRRPLTKTQAKDLGSFVVDKSLGRTFGIRRTKGKPTGKLPKGVAAGHFASTKHKFRTFKIVRGKRKPLKNKFIERRKRLLDTKTERKGITVRRLTQQLNKPVRKTRTRKVKSVQRIRTKRKATPQQLKNLAKGRKILAKKRENK